MILFKILRKSQDFRNFLIGIYQGFETTTIGQLAVLQDSGLCTSFQSFSYIWGIGFEWKLALKSATSQSCWTLYEIVWRSISDKTFGKKRRFRLRAKWKFCLQSFANEICWKTCFRSESLKKLWRSYRKKRINPNFCCNQALILSFSAEWSF